MRERGFTLVEMLVALALLALVGLALTQFQTFQLSAASRMMLLGAARLEADNRAVELLLGDLPAIAIEGESANFGRIWYWRATPVEPGGVAAPAATRGAGAGPTPMAGVDLVVMAEPGGPPLARRWLARPS